ncbi:phosphoribosyltransferase [Streptomyces phaeoluteigriseus]|uniref:phosphoribosyltransferase n=1 Tax=Streptomyces phaeoluteigriseus TaxID=114686 RepID=UPI0013020822|nr:phosphoribosyltransferase family protein [Streptomyces phaeoluteigriseus]
MDAKDMGADLKTVLITKEEIDVKLAELAAKIDAEYAGKDLLIVGVLKGAVMVMADLARALSTPVTMDWMAVSSYGAGTQSSGVVRILKDLDTDIKGKHVLIVEDIIDSGLTLSWLLSNLARASPHRSRCARCCASRRRPRSRSTWSGSASTSPTSSSWATASTTPRSTGTSRSSVRSRLTCTAAEPLERPV